MNKTFIPSCTFDKKKWYIINCKNKQLGRISSYIIPLLIGKTKPYYLHSIELGNYVILINVEFILFDKKKKMVTCIFSRKTWYIS
jgi:ribosomal protein L13